MGMIGFWFLEVSSLLFVYMLFNFFLSGHMFPAEHLAAAVEARRARHPAAIPGLFSGRRVSAEDRGTRDVAGAGDSSGLGSVFHHRLPRRVQPSAVIARYSALRRMNVELI